MTSAADRPQGDGDAWLKRTRRKKERREARALVGKEFVDLIVDFQFLEEALKCYLDSAFSIIREQTTGALPCKLDRSDMARSLGGLIKQFARYSNDATLIQDLNALVPERNDCAHRAFVQMMTAAPDKNRAEARRLQEI
jgi:hypothetical protein